jgi:biotin operon repressor
VARVSQQLIDALQDGPKTVNELAATLYGSDDQWSREAVNAAIVRLRKASVPIERKSQYVWRAGTPQCEVSNSLAQQCYELLQTTPKTPAELARHFYQSDSRQDLENVQKVIWFLRRKHSVQIEIEAKYVLATDNPSAVAEGGR